MGKELPLARSEETGQPVLLAITGSGELIVSSYNGDKRAQEPAPSKVSDGGEVEDTEAESKSSRKTKRTNAGSSKSARRGRDNQDRESDRGNERADKPARRSAKELGITFPGSYCDVVEAVPHYWTEVDIVNSGSLLQCRFCHKHLWLPMHFPDSGQLGGLIKLYGKDKGYCLYLDRHRAAKMLIAKLQDLRRLEEEVTDKRKFARMADRILSDREYDRKETS